MGNNSFNINVHHITRVEGHGSISVDVKNGEIKDIKWEVVEAPRFFELMLKGKRYHQASHITSRICGICALGHTLASLRATEAAFDITPSEQTYLLRKLALHGETISSHILHVYFLVAPDLFNVKSVVPLVKTHTDVVLRALRLKKLGNDLGDIVAGRKIHPITLAVNGLTHIPSEKELIDMRKRLIDSLVDMDETVKLLQTVKMPDVERHIEFVALTKEGEYAFYDGNIKSTEREEVFTPQQYRELIKEFIVPYSTAKYAHAVKGEYMVGALARYNINYDKLTDRAKEASAALGLQPVNYNPFMNNIAQVVETVHCIEDAINIIDKLLENELKEEKIVVKTKRGQGVGAVEVPRGVLIHDYTYNENGIMEKANCIIPTNQNHANIEADFKTYTPKILDKPKEEIRQFLEMLVRAYDPCISCSTHLLDVKFV